MTAETRSLADLDKSETDGAAVLAEVHRILTRYVVFPDGESADAATLYAAATYAAPKANYAPRLIVRSPEKRCGKTRLIVDVLGQLVHRPLTAVSLSPAALAHSIIPDSPPTVILDETDTVFGRGSSSDERTELLRGILNSGFTRGAPYVRWDAQRGQMDECPTFAMAILGGIDNGKMPDTIEDRAVIITLRRKTVSESVSRYRVKRDGPQVRAVAERLSDWVIPHAEALGDAEPALPDALNDRAQDVWEPLLAVAELAGKDWPARALRAALALSGTAEDDAADTSRLLADLRDVFGDAESLHTRTILDRLHRIEEAPWGDWFGRVLSPRELSRMLRPYGVKPTTVRIEGVVLKGYQRDDLRESWERYLGPPPSTPAVTSVTPVTSQVNPVTDGNTVSVTPVTSPFQDDHDVTDVTDEGNPAVTGLTCDVTEVTDVTDTPLRTGHKQLADKLDLERSAVQYRVKSARERGYLVNLEDRRGSPARYSVGDSLPEDEPLLPDQLPPGGCDFTPHTPDSPLLPVNPQVAGGCEAVNAPQRGKRGEVDSTPSCRFCGGPLELHQVKFGIHGQCDYRERHQSEMWVLPVGSSTESNRGGEPTEPTVRDLGKHGSDGPGSVQSAHTSGGEPTGLTGRPATENITESNGYPGPETPLRTGQSPLRCMARSDRHDGPVERYSPEDAYCTRHAKTVLGIGRTS